MKILVFDPVGGASGDMILGSLIHLGCPKEYLKTFFDAFAPYIGPSDMHFSYRWVNDIRSVDLKFDSLKDQPMRSYSDIRELIFATGMPYEVKERVADIFRHLAEAEARIHGLDAEDVHFHEVGAVDSILDIVGIAAAVQWFHQVPYIPGLFH